MQNYKKLEKLFLDMLAREDALLDIAEEQEEYVEERPYLQLRALPPERGESRKEVVVPEKKRVIIIDL
tara:strand:- start:158 stop:361 length:204 start_codon:yes stop_codon:yes gene_type:complete